MSYTVWVSALWETCVCTPQTSEPRIHPEMHRTDEPGGPGDRDHRQRDREWTKAWWGNTPTLITVLLFYWEAANLSCVIPQHSTSLLSPPTPTLLHKEMSHRRETQTYFIQLQVIEKLPEAVTELHEVPVHRILQLKTETHKHDQSRWNYNKCILLLPFFVSCHCLSVFWKHFSIKHFTDKTNIQINW